MSICSSSVAFPSASDKVWTVKAGESLDSVDWCVSHRFSCVYMLAVMLVSYSCDPALQVDVCWQLKISSMQSGAGRKWQWLQRKWKTEEEVNK